MNHRPSAAADATASASAPGGSMRVRVWDRFVRVFHWGLVGAMATAWLGADGGPRALHEAAGYGALALVAARVVWGFVGRGHARFDDFVPGPRRLAAYVAAMLRGREPRHLGHNPAAAAMILFLLALVTAIGVTGWLQTTDAYWGDEAMQEVHAVLVDVLLGAVAIHVAAAVYESVRHRENLVLAMFTGFKRRDVERRRARSFMQ